MSLQTAVIKYLTPIAWKAFPSRKISSLQKFSMVEKDSAARFMQYVSMVSDPEIKAHIFQHASEEFFHSYLFNNLLKDNYSSYSSPEILPKKFWLDQNSELTQLIQAYAYAYVGENRINKNFFAYNNKRMPKEIRSVFARISADEMKHADGTDEILLNLCKGDMILYKHYLKQAQYRRYYEEMMSMTTKFGEIFLNFILGLSYFILGPFCFLSLRNRFNLSYENEFEIFKQQVADFEASQK